MPFDQSALATTFGPSPTLAINERVSRLTAGGRSIYHLGFGESRFPAHPKILATFREHAAETSYPPVAGFPETREAIAAFYRREFDLDAQADRIIVGPGSKSLIYILMRALDGDVLLHRPAWVSYEPFARMCGKQVAWVDTHIADEYCLTPQALEASISVAHGAGHNPRILLINAPGNPTGVTYPEEVTIALAEIARANDLTVISDEIYAVQAYPHRPHVSIARYYPEGTVVTGGLSKQLSLGGWRFGCAVLPNTEAGAAMMRPLVGLAGNIWSAPAAPVQRAAVVAYSDDSDIVEYMQTTADIHRIVTEALYDQLVAAGILCPPPSGAYYLYPNFNSWKDVLRERYGVTTSDELAAVLLDKNGIATLPGTAFNSRPEDLSIRLATSYLYAEDDAQVARTLDLYARYADTGAPDKFLHATCPAVFEVGRRFHAFIATLNE